jgi:hypothetical protein
VLRSSLRSIYLGIYLKGDVDMPVKKKIPQMSAEKKKQKKEKDYLGKLALT